LSGEGLGEIFGNLVIGPPPRELIDAKWLSDFMIYVPKRLADLRGVRTVAGDFALGAQQWLATGPFKAVTAWAGRNEQRLDAVAAARGYKTGWVWHRLNH
jgi:hypothetical protein